MKFHFIFDFIHIKRIDNYSSWSIDTTLEVLLIKLQDCGHSKSVQSIATVYCVLWISKPFISRLHHSVHPTPPFLLGGTGRGETGVEPITKFLEKWGWGLTGPQLLERVFFSVITKNSNREISPKNLVTFKR